MSMNPGARQNASTEMNVTPLIDVLLVLFVIFMIMPHHRGEQADVPMPNSDVRTPPPEDPIVIQLRDNGEGNTPQVTINHHEVDWQSLEAKLGEIYGRRVEKVAFLQGDPEIEFRFAAEALDAVHRAGVARVGLMGAKDAMR
jgi:biopolymer transport protein TolR